VRQGYLQWLWSAPRHSLCWCANEQSLRLRFEEKRIRRKVIILRKVVWKVMTTTCLTAVMLWPAKRWVAAIAVAIATFFIIGIPTAVIANPVFGRAIGVTSWSMPVLIATSVLSGMLFATYVRMDAVITDENSARVGSIGGFLAYLAVGCPVCNKLALIALGSTGAIQYFGPVQPYLGAAGILLLLYALRRRLVNESQCALPKSKKVKEQPQLEEINR
jgi:hypothetical protein